MRTFIRIGVVLYYLVYALLVFFVIYPALEENYLIAVISLLGVSSLAPMSPYVWEFWKKP